MYSRAYLDGRNAIAWLVELELAVLVGQPQVISIADGCLCARAGLQRTATHTTCTPHNPVVEAHKALKASFNAARQSFGRQPVPKQQAEHVHPACHFHCLQQRA